MFAPSSAGFLSLVVISSLSLSQAATNTSSEGSPSVVPQCAANCMSIKITEAANWFGPGDVQTYCQHPEFLDAYNKCLGDHCQGHDLVAGKLAGTQTCTGVTPTASGAPAHPNDPKNATAHPPFNGPAGTPENSTLTAPKNGTTPNTPTGGLTTANNATSNLNGALPNTTSSNSNSPVSNTANGTRFSGAVGSAAANASSQAGDATAISSSSALMLTAFSSCLLSLVI